jgi:hypothetical protein
VNVKMDEQKMDQKASVESGHVINDGFVPRKNWLYDPGVFLGKLLLHTYYSIQYEHGERLDVVKDKPFIFLPYPHTNYFDVLFDTVFLRDVAHRRAYHIMADKLSKTFQLFGGIPTSRMKDLKRTRSDRPSHAELEEARHKNHELYDMVIPRLLEQNEVIVIYPEAGIGTKNLNKSVLKRLMTVQDRLGDDVYMVPMHFISRIGYRPRMHISMAAGNPFTTGSHEDLEAKLKESYGIA